MNRAIMYHTQLWFIYFIYNRGLNLFRLRVTKGLLTEMVQMKMVNHIINQIYSLKPILNRLQDFILILIITQARLYKGKIKQSKLVSWVAPKGMS